MKRYRLKKDLPTFKRGELFHTDESGNLWRDEGQNGNHWRKEVMAYHHKTIERFPDILTDWFEEYEERDPLAKEALIEYLKANPEQRLMQAVCNFIEEKINENIGRDIEKRKKLDQMKNQLKEWAEKNDVTRARVHFIKYYDTGEELVRFRKNEDLETRIEIKGWPREGLEECGDYSIEDLLDKASNNKQEEQ